MIIIFNIKNKLRNIIIIIFYLGKFAIMGGG